MANWLSDGWTTEEWDEIEACATRAESLLREFDLAVGGGGGGLNPAEVAEFAARFASLSYRLSGVSSRY